MRKLSRFSGLLAALFLLCGCAQIVPAQPTPNVSNVQVNPSLLSSLSAGITISETIQPTLTPQRTPTLELNPSVQPSLTLSPTPLFEFDSSHYDPDIFGPIDITHNLPMIARLNEAIDLVFALTNMICFSAPVPCTTEGVLHYTYGESEDFQIVPLNGEIIEEMDSLVARLPASDPNGQPLQYFAEFTVPEAGYTVRYPGAGAIVLITADDFIPVELVVENPVQPGEIVYDFFWGFGADKVRKATYPGYPQRVGPPALDVADDGRFALLDPVNERILIFNPEENSYSSFALPFAYAFHADLAFDAKGRLMVCDFVGEEDEVSGVSIPQCYLLDSDGSLAASAPLYVRSPAKITDELKILDYSDARLISPFDDQGQANSRKAQRQKETWVLPMRYVHGYDPFLAHYADAVAGLAFEVHSVSPLDVLLEFEKTPQGYLLVFSNGERIRAVWIDSDGAVLKDVSLPNRQYSEINFNGQAAIAADGSLYVLNSTDRGIEIHFAEAP